MQLINFNIIIENLQNAGVNELETAAEL